MTYLEKAFELSKDTFNCLKEGQRPEVLMLGTLITIMEQMARMLDLMENRRTSDD